MCRGVVPPTSRCQPNPVFDLHSSFSRAGRPLAQLLADKEQETMKMPSGLLRQRQRDSAIPPTG